MNKKTISSVFFLIAAALCTLSVIRMITASFSGGIWLLTFGAVFLCFGSVILKKAKDEEKKAKDEKNETTKDETK